MCLNIGVGITGSCNLSCPHCYSKPYRQINIDCNSILNFIEKYPIRSINFGTGESILHPEFTDLIYNLYERGIVLSLTSNGYSIMKLDTRILKLFNDIDISIDFPDNKLHDNFRGNGAWKCALNALSICKTNNIEVSIVSTLMKNNYIYISRYQNLLTEFNCNLRLNIIKDYSANRSFTLTYKQFWYSMENLFDTYSSISCSEPLVNSLNNITPETNNSPCGLFSFKIHPDSKIVPCVYWNESDLTLTDLLEDKCSTEKTKEFQRIQTIPKFCLDNCEFVKKCGGGCASRRLLNGDLNQPDQYCPIYLRKKQCNLRVVRSDQKKDLVHSNYLCTFIFASH